MRRKQTFDVLFSTFLYETRVTFRLTKGVLIIPSWSPHFNDAYILRHEGNLSTISVLNDSTGHFVMPSLAATEDEQWSCNSARYNQ